jgi:hypothetical protein
MRVKYFSFFIIASVLFLYSCGPSLAERREEIEKGMKSWIGKNETELVAKWGAPTKSYKTMDGSRELTYLYHHTSSTPGYSWYDSWGFLHVSHPTRHQRTTERSFTIDQKGTVMAYHWEGF